MSTFDTFLTHSGVSHQGFNAASNSRKTSGVVHRPEVSGEALQTSSIRAYLTEVNGVAGGGHAGSIGHQGEA